MSASIYQIKISLKDSHPPIWRRFLVDSAVLLADLHKILQTVMGWTNSHLHQFRLGETTYAPPSEEDDFFDTKSVDSSKVQLKTLMENVGDKLWYEYDFGDSWDMVLVLEKILPAVKTKFQPICLSGKRNCPPEDCGGIWGYEDLLEVINKGKGRRYAEIMEWLGGEFDPEFFDLDSVNELLKMNPVRGSLRTF